MGVKGSDGTVYNELSFYAEVNRPYNNGEILLDFNGTFNHLSDAELTSNKSAKVKGETDITTDFEMVGAEFEVVGGDIDRIEIPRDDQLLLYVDNLESNEVTLNIWAII